MAPQRIAVIGSGYVGTVVAACLAHIGHDVVGVESETSKLEVLRQGRATFREAGLDELLAAGIAADRLRFTDSYDDAMAASDVVFICVGTPAGRDGHPDMSAVQAVAHSIAASIRHHHVLVTKSTVPVGTGRWLRSVIEDVAEAGSVSVVSNPEFLREGVAVHDFLHPDRVVVGSDDPAALDVMAEVYGPILEQAVPGAKKRQDRVPFLRTTLTTAEMTKYASNAFLATKISFANEVARLCEFVGADVAEVTEGMGLDSRIGEQFLDAGLGWGGSCFGKDISALVNTAAEYGYRLRIMESAQLVNQDQRRLAVDHLLRHLKTLRGAKVAVLGLAFKVGTDDLRDSPAVDICRSLLRMGAMVSAYDPMVASVPDEPGIRTAADAYAAAARADAIVVATEWPEFLSLDLARLRQGMRGTLFFDGRNNFDPARVQSVGFQYVGIGRVVPPLVPTIDLRGSAMDSTPSVSERL